MSDPKIWPRSGLTWHDMSEGMEFETMARTVHGTDAHIFRSIAAFYEPLFMDSSHIDEDGLYERQPVPGLLTLSIAEGLVILTGMLTGTGLALLGLSFQALAPVMVEDTVRVIGQVIESRPSSKGDDRGVVITRNRVLNQEDIAVMIYEPVRLIKGSVPHV